MRMAESDTSARHVMAPLRRSIGSERAASQDLWGMGSVSGRGTQAGEGACFVAYCTPNAFHRGPYAGKAYRRLHCGAVVTLYFALPPFVHWASCSGDGRHLGWLTAMHQAMSLCLEMRALCEARVRPQFARGILGAKPHRFKQAVLTIYK